MRLATLLPLDHKLKLGHRENLTSYKFHVVRQQQVYFGSYRYKTRKCAARLLSRPALTGRLAVFEPVTTWHLLLNGKPITLQEIA
jgi:hypothetical protein